MCFDISLVERLLWPFGPGSLITIDVQDPPDGDIEGSVGDAGWGVTAAPSGIAGHFHSNHPKYKSQSHLNLALSAMEAI